MSSPPPSGDPAAPRRRPFETWRKVMLSGAVLLLVVSITSRSHVEPPLIVVISNGVGYGLLAMGFALAMRRRRELAEERKKDAAGRRLAEERKKDGGRASARRGEGEEGCRRT